MSIHDRGWIYCGWLFGISLLIAYGYPIQAHAKYDSYFSVGMGIRAGGSVFGSSASGDDNRLMYGFEGRVRILRFLEVSASLDLNDATTPKTTVPLPYPKHQFAGLLHLASLKSFHVSLLAGLGMNLDSGYRGKILESYLVGFELNLKINDHFVFLAGLRFFFPTFETGSDYIANRKDQLIQNKQWSGRKAFEASVQEDLLDFTNLQVSMSLLFYI